MTLGRVKTLENASRIWAYMMIFISGVSVFLFPLTSYNEVSSYFMYGWGFFQLTSILGAYSVLRRKPLLEWRVVVFMAFGVSCYGIIGIINLLTTGQPSNLARIGVIFGLVFLLVSRYFFQWGEVLKAQEIEAVVLSHSDGDEGETH